MDGATTNSSAAPGKVNLKWLRSQLVPSAALLGLLLSAVPVLQARAQQPSPGVLTDQELARSVHNPLADFVKGSVQSTTEFELGPDHNVGDILNIEPSVSFSLNAQWDLIARPNLNIGCLPSPHEQFGLEDLQTSFFLTPAEDTIWTWGVGPIFQFPTASSSGLGTGRWSAGPTGALVYSEGPWFISILANQLMSFAGNHDRGSVDQTYIEPEVSYNSERGWYVQCDPSITYDWTADAANAWTIPMGADIGKEFKAGSQDLSLQIGAYDLILRPDDAPRWIMRVSATFLFPHLR